LRVDDGPVTGLGGRVRLSLLNLPPPGV